MHWRDIHKDTPDCRRIIRLGIRDKINLLVSSIHEDRLLARMILADQSSKGSLVENNQIVNAYLAGFPSVNNEDLVNLGEREILYAYYLDGRNRHVLNTLGPSHQF